MKPCTYRCDEVIPGSTYGIVLCNSEGEDKFAGETWFVGCFIAYSANHRDVILQAISTATGTATMAEIPDEDPDDFVRDQILAEQERQDFAQDDNYEGERL